MSECQLKSLEEASTALPWRVSVRRVLRRRGYNMRKSLYDLLTKMRNRIGRQDLQHQEAGEKAPPASVTAPLNLQPGEKVRVKSFEEIQRTLNEMDKFQGLSYTPAMKKYCGGTYSVLKKVELVFDERKWRMSAIRNVVLLDGVFCDGDGGPNKDWDGCDRTCYIWWKEGWLERVSDEK